ncbi:MAG: exosortase C-terminal domain/associated protein EpsI [Bryobacteraceae bacterium]
MRRPGWLYFAIAALLLLGAVASESLTRRRIPEPLVLSLDHVSSQIAGWTETNQSQLPPRIVASLDATSYISRTYQKGASRIDLFIAYYAVQRAGDSMHSPKHCLPGAGWEIVQRNSALIDTGRRKVKVNQFIIENLGTKLLMIYWYQSRDRIVANEYMGKLLLARDTFLTGLTGGSIVRVTLPDTPAAVKQGITFARAVIPQMQRCLGQSAATE